MVFAIEYLGVRLSLGNCAKFFFVFTSLWNRWSMMRKWSLVWIADTLTVAMYLVACLAQSGHGKFAQMRLMTLMSSNRISENVSGLIFSANVWNKNQVGSPHFMDFFLGTSGLASIDCVREGGGGGGTFSIMVRNLCENVIAGVATYGNGVSCVFTIRLLFVNIMCELYTFVTCFLTNV